MRTLAADPVDWLLEEDNPSVRFFTLTGLLGASADDPEARQANSRIMASGPVPAILDLQNPGGYWGEPGRFYADKYRGTVWTLLLLAELGADPLDARVQKACEFILENARDPQSGGFAYERSAKSGTGLASCVIPCLTGNMVYALIRLGYGGDSRVQAAIKWITDFQRADDGDGAPEGPMYERFEMCWGRHTCHMGAAKAFKALAAVPPADRNPAVEAKTAELAGYFLAHHLFKKSHNLGEAAKPGWLRFGFPLMYQTDVLELAGIFAGLRIHDTRLQEAIDVIRDSRTPEGKWIMKSTTNGKTAVDIEKKGQPSKWLTLRALKVLKEYS